MNEDNLLVLIESLEVKFDVDVLVHITNILNEYQTVYQTSANKQFELMFKMHSVELPSMLGTKLAPEIASLIVDFLLSLGQINSNLLSNFRNCLSFVIAAYLNIQSLNAYKVLVLMGSVFSQELIDRLPQIAAIAESHQHDISELILSIYQSSQELPNPSQIFPLLKPRENGTSVLNLAKIMIIVGKIDLSIVQPYLPFIFEHCPSHPDQLSKTIVKLATIVKAPINFDLIAELFDTESESDCIDAMAYMESILPNSLPIVSIIGDDLFWAVLEDGITEGSVKMKYQSLSTICAFFRLGNPSFNHRVLERSLFGDLENFLLSGENEIELKMLEMLDLIIDYSSLTGDGNTIQIIKSIDFHCMIEGLEDECKERGTALLTKIEAIK